MKHNRIAYALIVALAGAVAVTGCKKKEEAAPPPPPEPAPASVEPAPAPAPAASFTVNGGAASDKISVMVTTDASVPAEATINAKLTYQDGQTAGEQSTTIKAEDSGTTTIDFTKASPWPAGKYTVDVTLNGAPVGMPQDVEIK
ncbi:MAG: hypothetical protein QM761_14435 [Pseudoxanthomonas sp.]